MAHDRKRNEPGGKIVSGDQGRSVWADTVQTGKFDLVTTQELRAILDASDDDSLRSIEQAATSDEEGVLARNAETGMFEIIDEESLQEILGGRATGAYTRPSADVTLEPPDDDAPSESFSLVSTRALRKIIGKDAGGDSDGGELDADIIDTEGSDPYNSG